jgi:hypothetical protein
MSVVALQQNADPERAASGQSAPDEECPIDARSDAPADTETTSVRHQFLRPAEAPTQSAPYGARFDFNDGCRVLLPKADEPWRERLFDLDTGNVLFETEIEAGSIYLGDLSGWSVVGTGDCTGNGVSGIVWQNQSTGATYEWTMSNGQQTGSISLGNLAGWSGK